MAVHTGYGLLMDAKELGKAIFIQQTMECSGFTQVFCNYLILF